MTQGALVLPEEGTAEVTYEVRPGTRYRFGPMFVAGTAAVSRDVIREQAAGAIRTGEWWDESKLAAAQARVFELGVFGGVRVTRGTPDPRRGTIPVVVAVREAPFRTMRFGPGLGVEATRWEARAMLGWEHRNFLGDLRRVSTDLRAGYAWVPTPWGSTKEGPVALLTGEFQQPAAFARWLDASARVELEKGLLEAYDYYAERLKLGLPLRLAARWSIIPSWNLEVYQLSKYDPDRPPGATPTDTGPTLENCVGSVCLLSYLEQRLAWDGRDDPLEHPARLLRLPRGAGGLPRRDVRLPVPAALARAAGLPPARPGHRARLPRPLRRARPARRDGGAAARRAVLRGWADVDARLLHPAARRHGPPARRAWVPVGGNGLADGSLELRFGLTRSLGGVLFVDAGAVSDANSSPTEYQTALDVTRLQYAAGVGLRYRTPFGPLRLDVGARLPERFDVPFDEWFPPVPYAYGENGALVVHREPIVAVHLALGEAF